MQNRIVPILIPVLLILLWSSSASGQDIILQDTFNDDTLGPPTGVPEVGSVTYYGSGTHSIINDYGSQSLRSVDASVSNGFAVQWLPVVNAAVFEVSYEYRIESYANSTSVLSVQRVDFTNPGDPFRIQWKHGGILEAGGMTTSLSWSVGTTYAVRIRLNCDSDRASVWIDGNSVLSDQPLSAGCDAMLAFVSASDFAATSSDSIDTIQATADTPIFTDGFESGSTSGWSSTFPPPAPSGESCSNAIPFTGGNIVGDLSDNTASGLIDSCSSGNTIDEWVSYTAPCTGFLTVSTCHPGTVVDTVVSTWSHSSCTGITELACNDDAVGAPVECDLGGLNRKSLLELNVMAGSTYVFRVSSFSDGVGAYEISAFCVPDV